MSGSVSRLALVSALAAIMAVPAILHSQETTSEIPTATIRANTRLVLVDVVVTDKKGQPSEGGRFYRGGEREEAEGFRFRSAGSGKRIQDGSSEPIQDGARPSGNLVEPPGTRGARRGSYGADPRRVELSLQRASLRARADAEVCG
jgi:hypothetical protein